MGKVEPLKKDKSNKNYKESLQDNQEEGISYSGQNLICSNGHGPPLLHFLITAFLKNLNSILRLWLN